MLTNKKYSGRMPLVVVAALLSLMIMLPLAGCKNDTVPPEVAKQEQADGGGSETDKDDTAPEPTNQEQTGDSSGGVGTDQEPTQYTVTFNANGGTGTMAPQTFAEGMGQKLTANGFTNGVKSFVGWAESADGAVKYTDGQEVTIAANATLYARWQVTAAEGTVAVVVSADGNSSPYTDLSAAVSALAGTQGSTLYLTQDYSGGTVMVSSGSSFTLDLNGKVMKNTSDMTLNISVAADLTITDTVGGGRITSAGQDCGAVVNDGGTVHITGGSIEGSIYGVNNSSGVMTVSGGSISAAGGRGIRNAGELHLSGNPAISGSGENAQFAQFGNIPYGGIYFVNSTGSIDGQLAMPESITVETGLVNLLSGSWTAFQGTDAYKITDADREKLKPVVTELPASMTSSFGMNNGATLSTALEGNAIVVKMTAK